MGLSWVLLERDSFLRVVGWPLLAWWRLIWVYRRHWQPVMIVSGLGRHIRPAFRVIQRPRVVNRGSDLRGHE
jgi:hypothetical protein